MEDKQPVVRKPRVLNTLESTNGVLVSCKMENGEPVFVPLKTLLALLEQDLASKMRLGIGVKF